MLTVAAYSLLDDCCPYANPTPSVLLTKLTKTGPDGEDVALPNVKFVLLYKLLLFIV